MTLDVGITYGIDALAFDRFTHTLKAQYSLPRAPYGLGCPLGNVVFSDGTG